MPGLPFGGLPVGAASAAKLVHCQLARRPRVSATSASRLTPLPQTGRLGLVVVRAHVPAAPGALRLPGLRGYGVICLFVWPAV